MTIPLTYTNVNETGCCAVPNVADWDKAQIHLSNQHFIRAYTKSFFHIPLNMAKIMKQLDETATNSEVRMPDDQVLILSRELSAWKAEQLYAVNKPVDGADNVTLTGDFISLVFEGPYKNANKWAQELRDYVTSEGKAIQNLYFFYTTCPKCAKHYGRNYVIGLAEV